MPPAKPKMFNDSSRENHPFRNPRAVQVTVRPTPRPRLNKVPTPVPGPDIHVLVKLGDKFGYFPEDLLELLEEAYKNALRTKNVLFKKDQQVQFAVMKGIIVHTLKGGHRFIPSQEEQYTSVAEANISLLAHIVAKETRLYDHVKNENTIFIRCDTEVKNTANPEFLWLHSCRREEISWGFDKYQCLSLYRIKEVDGRVKAEVHFVRRVEIKREHPA